jgi:hypothetical protein
MFQIFDAFLCFDALRGHTAWIQTSSQETPGKDPVPIVQQAGWALGPVWTGAENLAPTGIRSPEHCKDKNIYFS